LAGKARFCQGNCAARGLEIGLKINNKRDPVGRKTTSVEGTAKTPATVPERAVNAAGAGRVAGGKPAVSVIVPTFNRAGFLKQALDSVRAQTWRDYELIVVDDGSTDGTAALAEAYPGARWLRLPVNGGVSRARNRGILQARGRFICFLDSDDSWLPGKLERQMRWMRDNPQSLVCYTDEIWIRRGVRVNPMNKHRKLSGDIFERSLALCIVSPSSVLMRREVFDAVGGFDEGLEVCEDYDLWLRIAARFPVHFLAEKLIVKRGGHADQLSRKHWGMDRFRVRALEKLLADPALGEQKGRLAAAMLVEKCAVLISGFSKRGKRDEAERYRQILERHAGGVAT